jgi:hypothetical protein
MIKKLKPGKISIVVFLTALIWVWADLAQDDRLPLSDIRLAVAPSTDPSLWVNFVVEQADPNLQTSVALDTVVLKGPASRVAEVRRRKNKGTLDLNLFIVPAQEGLTQAEAHPLNVLDFLRKSDVIRNLGLTVESCEPKRLTIQTHKLVEQDVAVECVGIDTTLWVPTLNPSSVTAYVPAGRTLRARIPRLTPEEQNQAKTAPIEKTPYIELAQGADQRRDLSTKVKITLAPAQNVRTESRVPASYGFCFSTNLQGKYRVVLDKDTDLTKFSGVMVTATAEAKDAYYQAPVQLILYIEDKDVQAAGPIERDFVFAFPEDYVRTRQIEANQPAPKAKFTLVPIHVEPTLESPL